MLESVSPCASPPWPVLVTKFTVTPAVESK